MEGRREIAEGEANECEKSVKCERLIAKRIGKERKGKEGQMKNNEEQIENQ